MDLRDWGISPGDVVEVVIPRSRLATIAEIQPTYLRVTFPSDNITVAVPWQWLGAHSLSFPTFHHVAVTTGIEDDDGEAWEYIDEVEFTCTAPPTAPCRNYPGAGCDCEHFLPGAVPGLDAAGHPYVPGQECWLQGWFDAEAHGLGTINLSTGEIEPVQRSGPIRLGFFEPGVGPTWDWVGR